MEAYTKAFLEACSRGHFNIVEALLDQHREIELNNPEGISALKGLAENDIRRNIVTTLFIRSCDAGNINTINAILSLKDKNVLNDSIKKEYGRTGLIRACINGNDNVVRLLLESPHVDINIACENDMPPIFWAANHGHKRIVEMLLKREDLNLSHTKFYDFKQMDAARFASYYGKHEVAKIISNEIQARKARSSLRTGKQLSRSVR